MTAAADALAAPPSREPARHSMTTRVVIYGALVLFAIVYLMPLVVMVMTSLEAARRGHGREHVLLPA